MYEKHKKFSSLTQIKCSCKKKNYKMNHKCWINHGWSWILLCLSLFVFFLVLHKHIFPSLIVRHPSLPHNHFRSCVSSLKPSTWPFSVIYHPKPSFLSPYQPHHTRCHSPQGLRPLPLECNQTYFSSDNFNVCV